MLKKFPKLMTKERGGQGEKEVRKKITSILMEKKAKKNKQWGTINNVQHTQRRTSRESLSASSHSSIIKSRL